MPEAVSRRGFVLLWVSSTASALASGLVTIAAPLLVATASSDPLAVSAAFAVAWLPWLLFALPSGVLVDRTDRRRLVVGLDVVRAATVALLAGRSRPARPAPRWSTPCCSSPTPARSWCARRARRWSRTSSHRTRSSAPTGG